MVFLFNLFIFLANLINAKVTFSQGLAISKQQTAMYGSCRWSGNKYFLQFVPPPSECENPPTCNPCALRVKPECVSSTCDLFSLNDDPFVALKISPVAEQSPSSVSSPQCSCGRPRSKAPPSSSPRKRLHHRRHRAPPAPRRSSTLLRRILSKLSRLKIQPRRSSSRSPPPASSPSPPPPKPYGPYKPLPRNVYTYANELEEEEERAYYYENDLEKESEERGEEEEEAADEESDDSEDSEEESEGIESSSSKSESEDEERETYEDIEEDTEDEDSYFQLIQLL